MEFFADNNKHWHRERGEKYYLTKTQFSWILLFLLPPFSLIPLTIFGLHQLSICLLLCFLPRSKLSARYKQGWTYMIPLYPSLAGFHCSEFPYLQCHVYIQHLFYYYVELMLIVVGNLEL